MGIQVRRLKQANGASDRTSVRYPVTYDGNVTAALALRLGLLTQRSAMMRLPSSSLVALGAGYRSFGPVLRPLSPT